MPVVYTPGRDKVWKLDAANGRVLSILGPDDVADVRTKEADSLRRAPGTPRALVHYSIVPAAGAFRLSRLGELDQVLDEYLQLPPRQSDSARILSIDLGLLTNRLCFSHLPVSGSAL